MSTTGAIDPEIAAARAKQAQNGAPFDITALPPAEGRARADAAALFFNDGGPAVETVETFALDGPAGPMRARLYHPANAARALLFLHGGGWVTCNVDTHDGLMRRLALAANSIVVGVDYRLAPEHPFPAALEDAIAAWRWLTANATKIGVNENHLGIAGDSVGANLALALSISERDAQRPLPRAAALFYGAFAPDFETGSHAANGDGRFGLTTARMRWYWRQYLGNVSNAPALAAPLNLDLSRLSAHYLSIAELDPLADDTRMLAQRLEAAGSNYELDVWPGAVHGFMQMGRDVGLARQAIAKAGDFFKRVL